MRQRDSVFACSRVTETTVKSESPLPSCCVRTGQLMSRPEGEGATPHREGGQTGRESRRKGSGQSTQGGEGAASAQEEDCRQPRSREEEGGARGARERVSACIMSVSVFYPLYPAKKSCTFPSPSQGATVYQRVPGIQLSPENNRDSRCELARAVHSASRGCRPCPRVP